MFSKIRISVVVSVVYFSEERQTPGSEVQGWDGEGDQRGEYTPDIAI